MELHVRHQDYSRIPSRKLEVLVIFLCFLNQKNCLRAPELTFVRFSWQLSELKEAWCFSSSVMNTVCRCLTLCCEQKQGTCIKNSARLIDWSNFWSHGDLEGCRSTDKLSWAIFILLNTHLLSSYTCVLTSICIISKSFWNVQTRTLAATNSNPLTQRLMSSDSQKLEVSCPVVSYLPDVIINVWWLLFVFRFLDSFTLYSWQVWNSLSS